MAGPWASGSRGLANSLPLPAQPWGELLLPPRTCFLGMLFPFGDWESGEPHTRGRSPAPTQSLLGPWLPSSILPSLSPWGCSLCWALPELPSCSPCWVSLSSRSLGFQTSHTYSVGSLSAACKQPASCPDPETDRKESPPDPTRPRLSRKAGAWLHRSASGQVQVQLLSSFALTGPLETHWQPQGQRRLQCDT